MGNLFVDAVSTTAYFKGGIYGFQGSGKTYTTVELMIGLHKYLKSDKPIYFLDTETGSDWAIPRFKEAGIVLRVAKSRAFADLMTGIKEAEEHGFGLIIDSASHYWRELMESFQRKLKIKKLQIYHWTPIKQEWGLFTEALVNSKLHVMVAGRAGWDYDMEENEDGHKDLIKTGTKMKAEGEFGFEPSLVLEMQRIRMTESGIEVGATKGKGRQSAKIGDRVVHRCHVIKDRRMDDKSMDGQAIDNPSFADFMPHIEALNFGGDHLGIDTDRNSDDMFERDGGDSYREWKVTREVLLSDLKQLMIDTFPGKTGADTKAKADMIEIAVGTRNWERMDKFHREYTNDVIAKGIEKLKEELPAYLKKRAKAEKK